MHYLNLELTRVRSEEFLGASPVERATWLSLLCYCCGQESGGVVMCCREWSDRKWQQICGVTAEEVKTQTRLWRWEGTSIIVWGYPLLHEERAKTLRGQAKGAALKRWKHRARNGSTPPKVKANGR